MKAPLHSALTVPWSAGGAPNGRNTTADPGDDGGFDPSFLVKDSNCLIFHNSWVFFDEPLHFGHIFFGKLVGSKRVLYHCNYCLPKKHKIDVLNFLDTTIVLIHSTLKPKTIYTVYTLGLCNLPQNKKHELCKFCNNNNGIFLKCEL